MIRILSATEMKAVDRYAIETIGIAGAVLMESAGRSIFSVLKQNEAPLESKKIAVVCGPGNNGGDGFVVARYLKLAGVDVEVFLLGARHPDQKDAATNFTVLQKMGVDIRTEWKSSSNSKYDLIIDALFGTGLTRALTEPYAGCIRSINKTGAHIYSADIPSGLHSDTGKVMGEAIQANHTIALGFPKKGFYLNEGPDLCGEIHIADLSFADDWADKTGAANLCLTEAKDLAGWFLKRKRQSHKTSFGHLMIVAGSPGKSGAAVLSTNAAIRAGAGLVTLATPENAHTIIKRQLLEAMSVPLPSNKKGGLPLAAIQTLLQNVKGKKAVVVGPGLEPSPDLELLLTKFFKEIDLPIVLDADGLNAFGPNLLKLGNILNRMILTPHPGEMARLLGIETKDVQANRIDLAKTYAERTGAVVVLKGAFTVVALPNGSVRINPTGNPAMATAGTGDVLAGMIGGYWAQGLSREQAAIAGVFYHGLAGDRVAERKGGRGLKASDLIEELPRL